MYHITDWKKIIWQHPNNLYLARHRDPNILHPGDRVYIPALAPKVESRATGHTHEFVVRRTYDVFHVRLLYHDDTPIKHVQYVLRIGDQEFKGQTNEHGE